MLEIPESTTISLQVNDTLIGKTITEVATATSPHRFTFYCGDPADYSRLLVGKKITSTHGHGMFVDIHCDRHTTITIGDGTNMRYYQSVDERPWRHQLLIAFSDGSSIVFTVAMYGGIWAYAGGFGNEYHERSLRSISPLNDAFDEHYFDNLFKNAEKDISLKAFLATEQRIPGIGNGVLQDILFNAGLHPRCKQSALTDSQKKILFRSLKATLRHMTDQGGRDTEKDLYGRNGGYMTLLSKNTFRRPCPRCSGTIVKESYLGGSIYFCPGCQRL